MNGSESKKEASRWHTLSSEALSRELQADPETGLPEQEARIRLVQQGPNELPQAPLVSPVTLFLRQFSSIIIWVLIGAALVSGLLQEWVDAAAILVIVALNAVLGFVQEFRAERSLEALKRMEVVMARVVRNGEVRGIPARDVVPGDLIEVAAGDRIPADARLLYAAGLRTQEASLTGESTPVEKVAQPMPQGDVPLGDRRNMLYMGTVAAAGRGRAVVVRRGYGQSWARSPR